MGTVQQNSVTETVGGVTSWTTQDTYDQYGNRATMTSFSEDVSAPSNVNQFDTATNRIMTRSGGSAMPSDAYDGAGNLRDHPDVGQMTYDGENRPVSYASGADCRDVPATTAPTPSSEALPRLMSPQ